VANEQSADDLTAQLAALDVAQFVGAAASTIASLAYAKLEGGELDQARQAIDALVALCPHVGAELRPDLERTVTSLQVAYATAASA
jgi:hypothetical protein